MQPFVNVLIFAIRGALRVNFDLIYIDLVGIWFRRTSEAPRPITQPVLSVAATLSF